MFDRFNDSAPPEVREETGPAALFHGTLVLLAATGAAILAGSRVWLATVRVAKAMARWRNT